MRDGYMRGALSPQATQRQMDVLAAYVAAGGSVAGAAGLVRIRPSTVKRHLADLRARSGLTTEQLIYRGRAEGWLVVPDLEPQWPPGLLALVEPVGPGGRASARSRRPSKRPNSLRADGRQLCHGRAIGLVPGLHALRQQVHDHPDLADEGRDDQERLDLRARGWEAGTP